MMASMRPSTSTPPVQYTVNKHLKLTFEGVNLTDQYESEFD